jgi:hypothetical protein
MLILKERDQRFVLIKRKVRMEGGKLYIRVQRIFVIGVYSVSLVAPVSFCSWCPPFMQFFSVYSKNKVNVMETWQRATDKLK